MGDQESKEADDDQRQHPHCVILLVVEQHNPSQTRAADDQHLKRGKQRPYLITSCRKPLFLHHLQTYNPLYYSEMMAL